MAEREELTRDIGIGLDVEAFLTTAAGRRLLERFEEAAELAINGLIDADSEDPKEIRRLQNTIKRSRGFKEGLLEMIQVGENAETQLSSPGEEG